MLKSTDRVQWVDCAKGIGILLVIIGHSLSVSPVGKIARGVIFSFHMPLFFILSSVTYHCSGTKEELLYKAGRAARHLLLPLFFIVFAGLVWYAIYTPGELMSFKFWRSQVYTLILGSAITENFSVVDIPCLGIPWFFYALFFGRTLYDYINLNFPKNHLLFICCLLAVVGIAIGLQTHLPFSFDIVLAIQPFFWFGQLIKTNYFHNTSIKSLFLPVGVWVVSLALTFPSPSVLSYFELGVRRYPLLPICYFGAIAGTVTLGKASILLTKNAPVLSKPFCFLGKSSMYILIIHALDYYWKSLWMVEGRELVSAGRRLLLDLLVFALYTGIRELFLRWKKRKMSA